MFHPPPRRILGAAVLAVLLGALAFATSAGAAEVQPQAGDRVAAENSERGIGDGKLRAAVRDHAKGKAPKHVRMIGDRVVVEIEHDATADVRGIVERLGGVVTGSVPGALTEAQVPIDRIPDLAQSPGIGSVHTPRIVSAPAAETTSTALLGYVTGEEVAKTNADKWHAMGRTGAGVRIGIVDGFDGSTWDLAEMTDEVPTPAGMFCRVAGSDCSVWDGNSDHGVAVAEIVHEMAPGASIYLATAGTASDLRAAVDYFAANGVKVITRSLTAEYDGPGDGTGPLDAVIDYAVSKGMTWFNSAGNGAGTGDDSGQYWRGPWRDADGDGWLDFAPGDETMEFTCGMMNGLRWNDWGKGVATTDYDLYVFDDPNGVLQADKSDDDQTRSDAQPLEIANDGSACDGNPHYLAVKLYAANGGTSGDILEFMVNRGGLEYWQNAYSASGPAADSKSAGMITVGAVDPATGTAIAGYSSQGPTNDGRIKPDLSAAACVLNSSWSPCFNGTSAATPVAAGAAALVIGAGLATAPADVKTYLTTKAVVDRGVAGNDNVYGRGELVLPLTPVDTTAPTVTKPLEQIDVPNRITSTTVPVRLSWSASDASGIAAYELWTSVNGTWSRETSVATQTQMVKSLTIGTTHQFKVRAKDGAGNWSGFVFSDTLKPSVSDDKLISAVSPWSRVTWTGTFGGTTMASSSAGSWVNVSFTGRDVALVAPKFSTAGRAKVYCDGVYYGLVDLSASSTSILNTVFWCRFTSVTTHTMKVVVEGTSGRPRVDIDAFAVLS